jgi:hypothetical protein
MKKRVYVSDLMQKRYSYILAEPLGKNFDPSFQPELTPKEMLELGVFGGVYMRDCKEEFPKDWFINAKLSTGKKDPAINFFGVDASKSLKYWQDKNWIYPEDPRGWFQWYCRYYMGRRSDDDIRQIKRFRAMNRHIAQLKKNCPKGVLDCRPRQRQALLHWAIDSRKI